jgi:hypothetical protein
MRKVPELFGRGGYVAGIDHTVASDVPPENFCDLVELLRQVGETIGPQRPQF